MQRLLIPLLALLALVTLTPMVMAQAAYKISPGDTLQLEVLEDPGLNRSLLVLPDGTITVPSGGTIRAAGHTVPEVKAAVVQDLTPGFAKPPTVNLAVGQLAPKTTGGGTGSRATVAVYAMGEVANPGRIDVEPGTTLLQLLAMSGGFTSFAASKRIQVRRVDASGHQQVYPFNYDAVLAGQSSPVFYLQKGDVIIVPQRHLFE
jgi:polysaccharide export outer membrane protein